jgi:hypothetical protein
MKDLSMQTEIDEEREIVLKIIQEEAINTLKLLETILKINLNESSKKDENNQNEIDQRI